MSTRHYTNSGRPSEQKRSDRDKCVVQTERLLVWPTRIPCLGSPQKNYFLSELTSSNKFPIPRRKLYGHLPLTWPFKQKKIGRKGVHRCISGPYGSFFSGTIPLCRCSCPLLRFPDPGILQLRSGHLIDFPPFFSSLGLLMSRLFGRRW